MASTYSPLLRLELIAAGEQAGLWGNTTNSNLGTLIEQAIAGCTSIAFTGASPLTYTLSQTNGTPDEARSAVLLFTGTPTGAVTVTVPALQKTFIVKNATTQALTLKTAAQVGGVTLASGAVSPILCDGTNVYGGIEKLSMAQGGTGGTSAETARAALDVPTRTGGNASGTWPISISGNAATATTATSANNATTVTNGVYTTDLSTTGGANKVPKLTSFGVLGIGTSAKPWAGSNVTGAIEFGTAGFVAAESGINSVWWGSNAYLDYNVWKYKAAGHASFINTNQGNFFFYTNTASGLQDAPITLSARFSIFQNGNATLSGSLTQNSDSRFKTDLMRVTGALNKVCSLTGYTYRRTDVADKKRQLGLIAQDVLKVAPEAVAVDDKGFMSVAYGNLVGLLIEAVKDLATHNQSLEERVRKLEAIAHTHG